MRNIFIAQTVQTHLIQHLTVVVAAMWQLWHIVVRIKFTLVLLRTEVGIYALKAGLI